jgi:hypothetical protein
MAKATKKAKTPARAPARERLKGVVQQLIEKQKELAKLTEDEEASLQLGRPCSPRQLARVEQALGKPIPPSYRAFLELYDGWDDFEGDAKILGSDDVGAAWVKSRIAKKGALFIEFTKKNPLASFGFPIFLGPTSSRLAVLDTRKVDGEGEMPVITYDYTKKEDEYASFTAFLEGELETVDDLIKDAKEGVDDDEDEGSDDDDEDEDEDEDE